MNYTKMIKQTLQAALAAGALLTFSAAGIVQAQDASNTTYRGAGRDPFTKYKPPVKRVKPVPRPVGAPSIEQRIAAYKTKKALAMNAQLPAPKPTTALLLSEAQVTGIFRTPRGYAAMVEAKPIKLSYVIYPGEIFFDGMLVAIEEDRLVFRKETLWSDGRREMNVEMKGLGVVNAVKDTLTTANAPAAAAPAAPTAAPKAKEEGAPAQEDKL
ncbi:MAG TPA: hypothetical protein VGX24_14745 [Pyrinomonadaceae bacterium]|jgi:hypothetical protein|nr:hypothetical protein [Pyrinomonadaceae bacterium]